MVEVKIVTLIAGMVAAFGFGISVGNGIWSLLLIHKDGKNGYDKDRTINNYCQKSNYISVFCLLCAFCALLLQLF